MFLILILILILLLLIILHLHRFPNSHRGDLSEHEIRGKYPVKALRSFLIKIRNPVQVQDKDKDEDEDEDDDEEG